MSTLGKILIVVQVIMSVLFMCAAGAVYTVQRNWKIQYDVAQTSIGDQRASFATEIEDLNKQIDELDSNVSTQENRADAAEANLNQLTEDNAELRDQINNMEQETNVLIAGQESAADSAQFRQTEAEKQREVNRELHAALEQQIEENRQLRDENYSLSVANDNLAEQTLALLEHNSLLERIVAAEGLSTDPRDIEGVNAPPPAVEGLVLDTRKDRTNRTKFAHVSIGSDDGLLVGHELDVYRYADQDGDEPRYLGRIRIVHLTPDESVGMVVEAAKNGIIEEGDNVHTRL